MKPRVRSNRKARKKFVRKASLSYYVTKGFLIKGFNSECKSQYYVTGISLRHALQPPRAESEHWKSQARTSRDARVAVVAAPEAPSTSARDLRTTTQS